MTFLNLALLGGTLAGLIPLIIHLWHRSRLKTVRWGAMFLLQQRTLKSRRRPRLEQWLVLLLRIALPLLLALCMARPVLTSLSQLHGTSPASLVILLDRSPSMAANAGGRSCLQRACEQAAQIIQQLPRGSEVAILPLDHPTPPLLETSTRLKSAAGLLAQIRPSSNPARIAESLQAAAKTLSEMRHANRTVLLLSDFQRVDWPESEAPERNRAAQRLLENPAKPRLLLFDVGQGTPPNVAVENLEFSRTPLGLDQPVTLQATLRNYDSKPVQGLRVIWRVDGLLKQENHLSLEPRASLPSLFTHRFTEPGSHLVEVATDADPITADNSFWASLTVREKIHVLLVNGAPSHEPLRGETDFLELALHPLKEERSLLATRAIDPGALNSKSLSSVTVLVLANVKSLNASQVADVELFVRRGGGLLVFPGNKIDSRWYNNSLFRSGDGLLPASFESLRTADTRTQPATLPAQGFQHPVLEPFGPKGISLTDTSIRSWFLLRLPPNPSSKPSNASLMATLDNGDPFLVEGRFGAGSVAVCSIPCSPDWSNLPARPGFVPLMQRLIIHLGSAIQTPRNLTPGETLLATFPAPLKYDPTPPQPTVRVLLPDNSQFNAPLQARGERWVHETRETLEAGPYVLTGPGGETQRFAVNSNRDQSNPELLSPSQTEAIAQALHASLVRSSAELDSLEKEARFGREIWSLVLAAALLCSFLELFTLRRFQFRKGGQP
jgi:hypothetical protein